ncbi:MAG: hypothetical protein ACP5I4_09245 [Oceanipulchritudo sp.]
MIKHPLPHSHFGTLPAVVLFSLVSLPGIQLQGQTHPRLLFGSEEIPVLREKITSEPYLTMCNLLLADAETGQYRSCSGPDAVFIRAVYP